MIHPMVIETDEDVEELVLKGKQLEGLLDKPKSILWKREEMYLWVAIETVKKMVRQYNSNRMIIYPPLDAIMFRMDECVELPKEAGEAIYMYNGHED